MPLVHVDAISAKPPASVVEQLAAMGEMSHDLEVLQQQRLLKAEAREKKAAKALAKGFQTAHDQGSYSCS